ncbi:MAG: hypothetical protein KIS94_13805 [Chitinophagales bacterium]|nr:hypothetical protein [Chitinophagales bacterium]
MVNNNLPHTARTWVYQSTRKLTMPESIIVREKINGFVEQWTSHKMEVTGWGDLLYDRFVILMADEEQVQLGGCSIDSSVRFVKTLEAELQTNFFDRWNIAYKKGNDVLSAGRSDFARLLETGEITDDTIVFNNLLHTKKDLLENWQVPYRESWLKNVALTNTPFSSLL